MGDDKYFSNNNVQMPELNGILAELSERDQANIAHTVDRLVTQVRERRRTPVMFGEQAALELLLKLGVLFTENPVSFNLLVEEYQRKGIR